VERGEMVSHAEEKPTVTKAFKANVFWMGRNPLKLCKSYKLKLTTEALECSVSAISRRINSSTLEVIEEDAKELANTEVGEVTLVMRDEISTDLFNLIPTTGRFVLVEGNRVAGGGIIVEVVHENLVVKDLRGAQCPFTLDHAKPLVEQSVEQSFSTIGLDGILYLMGFRDRETDQHF